MVFSSFVWLISIVPLGKLLLTTNRWFEPELDTPESKIVSVSKVRTNSYKAEKPKGFRDWQRDGRKCDVIYKVLQKPINIMFLRIYVQKLVT